MKKLLKLTTLFFAVAVIVALFSCESNANKKNSNPVIGDETVTVGKGKEKADLPEWYLNPPKADEKIYGVGSSNLSKLDAARKAAQAGAREDIASQLEAQIKSTINTYFQESGVDDNTQITNFVEQVSRQITQATLSGTTTEKTAVSADGKTVFALVSFPKANAIKEAEVAFVRNEDAAFAEFKAQEALKRLDAQLENNPTQAGSNQ